MNNEGGKGSSQHLFPLSLFGRLLPFIIF
jgi:hypothetical protein